MLDAPRNFGLVGNGTTQPASCELGLNGYRGRPFRREIDHFWPANLILDQR